MRFVLIDLLRFAAVALVILVHFFQLTGNSLGSTSLIDFFGQRTSIGGIGVSIFIVLSGLSLQLNKKNQSFKDFFKKRVLRIYPAYWMAVFFAMAIHFFLLKPFSLLDLACTVAGFCAFIGLWGGAILSVSWFVGAIVCLYLLFPFVSKAMQSKPIAWLVLLFCIALLSKIVISQFVFIGARALDWFPLSRVFEFGLGIFLAIKLPGVWSKFDWLPFAKAINFLGKHSFELFLFHYPLLELVFA